MMAQRSLWGSDSKRAMTLRVAMGWRAIVNILSLRADTYVKLRTLRSQ